MMKIDYKQAKYPVRSNFAESHNCYWERLANPGNWLTAAERVAISKEVRHAGTCQLCRQRKEALSPYQVDGNHDSASDLSDTMVEVVHRIITDSGRLTRAWFDGVIQQGLKVEKYVEIIGTLVHVLSIDEFCRGIGLPLHKLPEPLTGEGTQYRPDNIVEDADKAWVPMIAHVEENSAEADLWEGAVEDNVIRALSLVPDEVRSLLELNSVHYVENDEFMDFEKSPYGTLSRIQIEVIAARISAFNACFY